MCEETQPGCHRMSFSNELPVHNLFDAWEITSPKGLVLSCLAIFCFGIVHEYLKSLQVRYAAQDYCGLPSRSKQQKPNRHNDVQQKENGPSRPHSTILRRLFDTTTHVTLLVWSYFLMLSAMTFNPWIFASSVGGCAVGYLLFHWMPAAPKSRKDDANGETEPWTNRDDVSVDNEENCGD